MWWLCLDAVIDVVLSRSLPALQVMIDAGANKNDALASAVANGPPSLACHLRELSWATFASRRLKVG